MRSGKIGLVRSERDVFELSGPLPRAGWNIARWLYRVGSSSRLVGTLYSHIRHTNDYNRPGLLMNLMGRDIRKHFLSDTRLVVVSHPSLVGILAHRKNLIYQHGELIVPEEARVSGASLIIVPTHQVAECYLQAGYSTDQLYVSGLCIEPALVKQAEDMFSQRRFRLETYPTLTGAFFSSGAEPRSHVDTLARAVLSVTANDGRAIIFARRNGRLAAAVRSHFNHRPGQLVQINSSSQIPAELPSALLIEFSSRREENIFTSRFFPHFDYLVSPAHERTNWAVGLGLPIFIVGPSIGPFAPLNRQLILNHGVGLDADPLPGATLAGAVSKLRSTGRLMEMLTAGWGRYPINGFERIADELFRRYAE